jgi:hypothetical protein
MPKSKLFFKQGIYLVRIQNVVGHLYIPETATTKAIIHAKGGPSLGDDGNSAIWPAAKKYNYILFVPDYIGYCHSSGEFNFDSCIDTFIEAEQFLTGKQTAIDTFSGKTISLSCDELVLVGSSWGGAMVPFLEKNQKSSIKNIALIKPVTDWTTQGKTKDEEENTEQTNQFIQNGWLDIYRGYQKSEWPQIFAGKLTNYNPLHNIQLLKDKNVIICHGEKDNVISVKKSQKYYQEFKKQFPDANVKLKVFKNLDHSSKMNYEGLKFILKTLSK